MTSCLLTEATKGPCLRCVGVGGCAYPAWICFLFTWGLSLSGSNGWKYCVWFCSRVNLPGFLSRLSRLPDTWSWAISLCKPGPLPEDEPCNGTYITRLLPGSQAIVRPRRLMQHVNSLLVCQLVFLLNPFWYNSSLAFCFLFSLLQSFRKFFSAFLFKNILTQDRTV